MERLDGVQEELPSQHEMKIRGHNGFMPYMAVAQGIAASLTGPGKTAVCCSCQLSLALPASVSRFLILSTMHVIHWPEGPIISVVWLGRV